MSFFTEKHSFSVVSIFHYQKLLYRGLILLLGIIIYAYAHMTVRMDELFNSPVTIVVLAFLGIVMMVEMASRLVPSPIESMGCEKQFARNLHRTEVPDPILQAKSKTAIVIVSWSALNLVFGVLHILGVLDAAFMVLLCMFYALSDMICILFFCPFQSWMMGNKCCGTCRIYNWDYFMMFTPLVFVPSPYTYILVAMSLTVLVVWEYRIRKHPERFSEATNSSLSCAECPEKLCRHKKQLAGFIADNREQLQARGELLSERLRHEIAERQNAAKTAAGQMASEVRSKLPKKQMEPDMKETGGVEDLDSHDGEE